MTQTPDQSAAPAAPKEPEAKAYPLINMSWGQAQQAMKDGYTVVRTARIHGPMCQADLDAKDWMVVPPGM